jgi:antitoxin PrlF
MPIPLEAESTLTDRYQTTVPEPIRRVLGLGKRDRIHYTQRPNGEVVLTRVQEPEGRDLILESFLSFLARDIAIHPERLQALDSTLVQRLQSLVGEIDVDLDATLPPEDE